MLVYQLQTALNEAGEQVALSVGIVILHKFRQLIVHPACPHIRRVGDHRVVLAGEDLRLQQQRLDGCGGLGVIRHGKQGILLAGLQGGGAVGQAPDIGQGKRHVQEAAVFLGRP